LVVLSVVVGTTAGRVSFVDLVILVSEAVGFLVVGMAIGIYVLRRVVARIHLEGNTLGVPLGGFLVAVAITFLFALTAESLGLSAVGGGGRECPVFHDCRRPHPGHDPARAALPTGPESRRGGTPCGGRGAATRGNGAAAWLGRRRSRAPRCGSVREAHKPSRVTSSIGGGTV